MISQTNVLQVEGLCSRRLENSIAYLSIPHACCYWFIWKLFDVFVSVYLFIMYTLSLAAFAFDAFVFSISFSHADVVGGLHTIFVSHNNYNYNNKCLFNTTVRYSARNFTQG